MGEKGEGKPDFLHLKKTKLIPHWFDIQGVEGEDKGEGSQKRKMKPSFTVFFRPLRVSRKLFSPVKAFEGIAFTPNSPRMR